MRPADDGCEGREIERSAAVTNQLDADGQKKGRGERPPQTWDAEKTTLRDGDGG